MHICHVIDNMFLDQGGPVAVVHGLAKAQVDSGDRVTVVCRLQCRPGESRRPEHNLGGAQLREIDTLSSGSAKERLWETLNELKPAILHLHAVWEPIQRHAASWALRHAIPWVLSTHGMLHPVPMRKGWLKKRGYLMLLGVATSKARMILTLSSEEAASAHELLGISTEVVPNGATVTREVESPGQAPPVVDDAILFLGRLQSVKGIEDLVRAYAIARMRGVTSELAIVGPDEGATSTILKAAQIARIPDHVHLVGPLYGSAKRVALRRCRLLAHRPRYEGYGLGILEAMLEATAVVTTRKSGIALDCPPGCLALASDTDEDFASELVRVWQDDSVRHSLGTSAQTWARTNRTWPAIAAHLRGVYERACQRPVGSNPTHTASQ